MLQIKIENSNPVPDVTSSQPPSLILKLIVTFGTNWRGEKIACSHRYLLTGAEPPLNLWCSLLSSRLPIMHCTEDEAANFGASLSRPKTIYMRPGNLSQQEKWRSQKKETQLHEQTCSPERKRDSFPRQHRCSLLTYLGLNSRSSTFTFRTVWTAAWVIKWSQVLLTRLIDRRRLIAWSCVCLQPGL